MLLTNARFSHSLGLLSHPDERQRTDCLQDMFFFLLGGGLLHPDQWKALMPELIKNMDQNCDATLRRWSYQTASFSSNDPHLTKFLINNIESESNSENLSWIVSNLAKNLSVKELDNVLSQKGIKLTQEQIMLASYLFTDSPPFNPNSIISANDPLSLMWLASIGAYGRIAEYAKKDPIVSRNTLSLLTSETNNDEVLKHVMYAFTLVDNFSIDELRFDPFNYKIMGDQEKKWYFTLMWKDTVFLKTNIDFFQDLLSPRHLFVELENERRIGIARGLEKSLYIPDLAPYIANWYSHEQTPSSQYLLLRYMLKHKYQYGDFEEIIEYQKEHGDDSIKELIRVENESQPIKEKRKLAVLTGGISMTTRPSFKIGVTFCGEYREKYVLPFCNALLKYAEFNKNNIFYDEWHDYLINGVHGDDILRTIYKDKCELIVVLLSPNYATKNWTSNIEWPAIKELINTGEHNKICLLSVDNANIMTVNGLWKTQSIVKSIDKLTPDEVASFIYNVYKNRKRPALKETD